MNFMRRYGWYVFLIPVTIFVLDDYMTNWHDHGHERILYIILENLAEDIGALLLCLAIRVRDDRTMQSLHAECPHCHFKWVMHPKQKIPHCPHCGAPEPS